MNRLHVIAAVVAAGLAWAGIAHLQQTRREAREAGLKAEQRQRDEAALAAQIESEQRAKRERATLQNAIAGAIMLKQGMKDHESFVLQSAMIHPSGAICYRYTAKNYARQTRALLDAKLTLHTEADRLPSFNGYWAQLCPAEGGREVSDELKASALATVTPAKPRAAEQIPLANTDAVKGAITVPLDPNAPSPGRMRTPPR